jgi:hypothetical protein
MAEQVRNHSVEPQRRTSLLSVPWADVSDLGTCVEAGTGDLYRIPQQPLVAGGSPIIRKESAGAYF